jgi:HEAT repeat protein
MRPITIAVIFLCLCGCGRKGTDYWLSKAKDSSSAERLHAIHELKARSDEANVIVPMLIASLGDRDSFVRRDAARALGEFGPDAASAVPALLALRKDKESVRRAAVEALGQIDPSAAEQFKKPLPRRS